jgi:hypothetical protein
MAKKHNRRKHLLAKIRCHLSVGVGVVTVEDTIVGNIDLVCAIGDCFLT